MKKRAIGLAWLFLALAWIPAAVAAELSVDFTFSAGDVELAPVGEYTVVGLADGTRVMDEVGIAETRRSSSLRILVKE